MSQDAFNFEPVVLKQYQFLESFHSKDMNYSGLNFHLTPKQNVRTILPHFEDLELVDRLMICAKVFLKELGSYLSVKPEISLDSKNIYGTLLQGSDQLFMKKNTNDIKKLTAFTSRDIGQYLNYNCFLTRL